VNFRKTLEDALGSKVIKLLNKTMLDDLPTALMNPSGSDQPARRHPFCRENFYYIGNLLLHKRKIKVTEVELVIA
jgi:hypothetical protein